MYLAEESNNSSAQDTTTAVHENVPELRDSLANLMNHDVKTARKEYFLQEKTKSMASTEAGVRDITRTNFVSQDFGTSVQKVDLCKIFDDEFRGASVSLYQVKMKLNDKP